MIFHFYALVRRIFVTQLCTIDIFKHTTACFYNVFKDVVGYPRVRYGVFAQVGVLALLMPMEEPHYCVYVKQLAHCNIHFSSITENI